MEMLSKIQYTKASVKQTRDGKILLSFWDSEVSDYSVVEVAWAVLENASLSRCPKDFCPVAAGIVLDFKESNRAYMGEQALKRVLTETGTQLIVSGVGGSFKLASDNRLISPTEILEEVHVFPETLIHKTQIWKINALETRTTSTS